MDHDLIVEHLLDRCNWFIENILQASDLHRVAAASLAFFEPMRQVARNLLQANLDLEAQQRQSTAVARCCQDASVSYVHPRTVSPATLLGEVCIPVRTCQCGGCGVSLRADDRPLGVPEAGDFTDDGRGLYAPVVSELPHRVAHDLLQRCTGVADAWVSGGGAADLRVEVALDGVMVHIDGRWQEAKGAALVNTSFTLVGSEADLTR